jgi:hypothetical protein
MAFRTFPARFIWIIIATASVLLHSGVCKAMEDDAPFLVALEAYRTKCAEEAEARSAAMKNGTADPLTQTATHIYVSRATGRNASTVAGTEQDPFKSITYAMLTIANRNTPDPWTVHIKTGQYDSNPAKPVTEREFYPIEFRPGMTLTGEDGAETCVISGQFLTGGQSAIVHAMDCVGITMERITLRGMIRTSGAGAVQNSWV